MQGKLVRKYGQSDRDKLKPVSERQTKNKRKEKR